MNSDKKFEKENFEKKDYKEIRDFFTSKNNMTKYDSLFKYYNKEINLNDKLYLPKIIKELNSLIEDGFGFTILPCFSIPCHALLESYINSDLDEENNIHSIEDFKYIKIFDKLKNYMFISRENISLIYSYFGSIFYDAKNIEKNDKRLSKFLKMKELWKIFYTLPEKKEIINSSNFCFMGGKLLLRFNQNYEFLKNTVIIKINFLSNWCLSSILNNVVLLKIGEIEIKNFIKVSKSVNNITFIEFSIYYNKILIKYDDLGEIKTIDIKFMKNLDYLQNFEILENYFGLVKSIQVTLKNSNIKYKTKSYIIYPSPKTENGKLCVVPLMKLDNNLYHKELCNYEYDFNKCISEIEENRIVDLSTDEDLFEVKIEDNKKVNVNYINYYEKKFNIIEYFGGLKQTLPFMSLIKNLYKNDKIEQICNQNKKDILTSFVKDLLCSIITIACHYQEYEKYITEYYSLFFAVISELDTILFSCKDMILKTIKNFDNIDNEKKDLYSLIINNFFKFLMKENEEDTNDISANEFIKMMIKKDENIINNTGNFLEQLYKKLMKELFVFNRNWSKKELFYNKEQNKSNLSIKYKRLNYYTKNFQQPFIYPILEMDKYFPQFQNFDKKNLFKKDIYLNYDFSLSKNNIIINLIKSILEENSNKKKNIVFEKCCLVKEIYHIKGKIGISKNEEGNKDSFEIIFISNDKEVENTCNKHFENDEDDDGSRFASMNEKNKSICYGSLFKCPEKEYGRKIVIKSDDIVLVLVREYYHRVSALEIFTTKNKSYYFNFNKKFKIKKKKFFIKKRKSIIDWHIKSIINFEKNEANSKENSNINSINKNEDDDDLSSSNNIWEEIEGNNNAQENEIESEVKEAENFILSNLNTSNFGKIIIKDFLLGHYNKAYNKCMKPLFEDNCVSNLSFKYYSNFDIIMLINLFSNRSFKDIYQYPVFPMLYDHIRIKRDMKMHIGLQEINEQSKTRANLIIQTYNSNYEDYLESKGTMNPVVLFNTHYSNPIYTSNFLIRIFPYSFSCIELQGDGFDNANRLFYSIEGMMNNSLCQKSDLRELIPEFFYFPDLFSNINELAFDKLVDGKEIDTVYLYSNKTSMKKDIYQFISDMRQNLEKEENINEWIDLIFGKNQKMEKQNKMYYEKESYVNFETDDSILKNSIIMDSTDFGLVPFQLFYKKFPIVPKENIENIRMYNNIMIDFDHFVNYANPFKSCMCIGQTKIAPYYLELYNSKIKKEKIHKFMKELISLDAFCYYFIGDIFGNVTIYQFVNKIDNDHTRFKLQRKKTKEIINSLNQKSKKIINNVFSGFKKITKKIINKTKNGKNENEITDNIEENKNKEDIVQEKEFELKDIEVLDNEDKIEDNIAEGENKDKDKDNKIEEEETKIEEKDDKIEENDKNYYYAKFDRLSEKNIFKVKLFNKLHAHNEQIRYIDFNGRLNLFLTYGLDGYVNLYLFPSCKMINAIKITKITGNAIFTKVLLISNPFPMFICLNDKLIYVFYLNGDCIFVGEIINFGEFKIHIDKNFGIVPDFITDENGEEYTFPFIIPRNKD